MRGDALNARSSFTAERSRPARKIRIVVAPGTVFGEATYIEEAGYVGRNRRMVKCRCSCGVDFVTRLEGLRRGDVTTCPDCSAKRVWGNTKKHGSPPAYQSWASMIQRCTNPNFPQYKHWGGRGIKVCDRWRHSFEAFLEDMGDRPSCKHQIDRIDNDGNYEPGNCRWATQRQQRRNSSQNVMLEYDGRRACLAEWAESLGISPSSLAYRLKAWGVAKALTSPPIVPRAKQGRSKRAIRVQSELDRLRGEIDAQDGTDADAPDLTDDQWAKVKSPHWADYGAEVTIRWCGELEGIEDHGYLTCIPGQHGDWDMVGLIHIPRPWVEKESPIPEWHSLYSLCRNELVKEIIIVDRS